MPNYNTLQNSIRSAIKTNGNNEITGNLLQQILLAMVTSLGAQFQFAGVATPSTNPGSPDYNVAYIGGPGTYTNMGNVTVPSENLGVIMYNGSWSVQTIAVGGGGGSIPIATNVTLGGIIVGSGLQVDASGVLSVLGGGGGGGGTSFEPEITDLQLVAPAQSGQPYKLKFADRINGTNITSGKNYVILREMATFAAQVTGQNTIYEIRYNFDLNNSSVNLPENCVLNFNGGKISNGTLIGNKTTIKGDKDIFYNVTFSGTWDLPYTMPEWFAYSDDSDRIEKANAFGPTLLSRKIYKITRQVNIVNDIYSNARGTTARQNNPIDYNDACVVVYSGPTNATATPPNNAADSIFCINTIAGIRIERIAFVCDSSYNGGTPTASIPANDKFSAIKYVNTGVECGKMSVVECEFILMPIGINIYDLSQTGAAPYYYNVDSFYIDRCHFKNCRRGIYVDVSVYNLIVIKPVMTGGQNTIRHIEMHNGTIMVIEGYFGPLGAMTQEIKAIFYFDSVVKYYHLIGCYSEHHGGFAIYDAITSPPCNSLVDKCVFLAEHGGTIEYTYEESGQQQTVQFDTDIYSERGNTVNRLCVRNTNLFHYILTKYQDIDLEDGEYNGYALTDGVYIQTHNASINYGIVGRFTTGKYENRNKYTFPEIVLLALKRGGNAEKISFDAPDGSEIRFNLPQSQNVEFGLSGWVAMTGAYWPNQTSEGASAPEAGLVRRSSGQLMFSNPVKVYRPLAYGSKGATADRPSFDAESSYMIGYIYFDTTLGKMICWNGTAWINLDGSSL